METGALHNSRKKRTPQTSNELAKAFAEVVEDCAMNDEIKCELILDIHLNRVRELIQQTLVCLEPEDFAKYHKKVEGIMKKEGIKIYL